MEAAHRHPPDLARERRREEPLHRDGLGTDQLEDETRLKDSRRVHRGTLIALLRASHFPPTVAVTSIATALAIAVGRGWGSVWVALAVLAGQLSVGWSNDYLDRDRDRRVGRVDKPIAVGMVSAHMISIAALVAAGACVPLSFASGWRAALVHLGAVGIAWAYNARLKDSPLSPLPYTLAFGSLPIFVTLGLPGHPMPLGWGIVAAALLGTGAHFVNTLPDLADDARTGVRGLPHRLGPRASIVVAAGLMAAAVGMAGIAAPGAPDAATATLLVLALIAIAGVVVAASLGHARLAWQLTLCAALLSVGLFLVQGSALVISCSAVA